MDGSIFGFILMVLFLSFTFGAFAIKWQNDFKLKREQIRAGNAENSVGMSELQQLIQETIQEAVKDIVQPMEQRLDALESNTKALPASGNDSERIELSDFDTYGQEQSLTDGDGKAQQRRREV